MNVKPYDMQHDVIIACDFKSAEDTFEFLDLFRGEARKPFLKIGMELFYAEGPEIVREIKKRGHKIFLDLKLEHKSYFFTPQYNFIYSVFHIHYNKILHLKTIYQKFIIYSEHTSLI